MKHLTVVGVLLFASSDAVAQGAEVNTRWGPSGSHFTMSSGTQNFLYQATVTGCTAPFTVQLEVYHNQTLKFTDSRIVPVPTSPYVYVTNVPMQQWGLTSGDTVTFVLKVIDTASGTTLATHTLIGDVAGT